MPSERDEIIQAAVDAINAVLQLYDKPEIEYSSAAATSIRAHIQRNEPKRPVGRPRIEKELISAAPINHWAHVDLSPLVSCARCIWQVIGIDDKGQLWARVLNPQQGFVGKAVTFDRRMKPRRFTPTAANIEEANKLLSEVNPPHIDDLRAELNIQEWPQ